jgi:hypothetical protein
VELAFFTLLLKDGADRVGGGVAIDNKWVFKAGLMKDWSCADGIDECLEGRLVFGLPVKAAAFCAKCDEGIQGSSEHAKIADVHPIEIEETEEGAKFSKGCGAFPIFNTIDFNRIHSDAIFTDDDAEVFNCCRFELAFLRFEVEIVLGQNTQDIVNDTTVELEIIWRVNEDVVHINGDIALIN